MTKINPIMKNCESIFMVKFTQQLPTFTVILAKYNYSVAYILCTFMIYTLQCFEHTPLVR